VLGPLPRRASETSESGRGLAIIAAYARDAGTRPAATGQGKIVWALMPARPSDSPPLGRAARPNTRSPG